MEIGNPIRPDVLVAVTGEQIKTKILVIPPWNMDTVPSIQVAHGLTALTIMGMFGWVRNDADNSWYPITPANDGDDESLVFDHIDATDIFIARKVGRYFDQPAFSGVGFDRGRIHIFFED